MSESIPMGDGDIFNPINNIDDFFIISRYKGPKIDVKNWFLNVGGFVHRPMKISYEELTGSYSRVSEVITMECVINKVGGSLVGTAVWSGVALRDVLNEADIKEGSIELFCKSLDGLNRGLSLEFFQNPLTLLAYEMNGQILPIDHGFPLRLVVPGFYGFIWRKWLTELILTKEKYADPQWLDSMKLIKSKRVVLTSKILKPDNNEIINSNNYWIVGVSWGGETSISRVEVSLDNGITWNPTEIIWRHTDPYAWVVWRFLWFPPKDGSYVVTARAFDEMGRVQRDGKEDYPSGLGRLHSVKVLIPKKV
ncbi:MAG: molybdopterin-dependent oxidoreductase [Candidatus Bathyarchaeota archaeon]|nr:molybdopterin-dependent oxidoreductase [Candidatus Bathyarchaeota archaeon]